MKEDMYITLVSMRHFFGVKPFKKDGILKLIKEKDNNYDDEAIKVEMRHAGQVAYGIKQYKYGNQRNNECRQNL